MPVGTTYEVIATIKNKNKAIYEFVCVLKADVLLRVNIRFVYWSLK